MRTDRSESVQKQLAPDHRDLDDVTAYEDDGDVVICDTTNASAWIRSDVTVPLEV